MMAQPVIFAPAPEAAAAILADLDDCSLSFHDLARKHGTNSEVLALWLSTDPVKDRIQTTLDAMASRVRSAAISRLPAAARAVCQIVERYDGAKDPPDPTSPTYLADLERRRRRDESTRRACHLLLRLANFFSPLKPPSTHLRPGRRVEDPTWRGEVPSAAADRGDEGSGASRSVEVADPPGRTWRVGDPPWRNDEGSALLRDPEGRRGDRGGEESQLPTRGLHSINGSTCGPGFQPAPVSPSESAAQFSKPRADINTATSSPRQPTSAPNSSSLSSSPSSSPSIPSSSMAPAVPSASSPRRPPSAFISSPSSSSPPSTYLRPRQRFKRRRQLTG